MVRDIVSALQGAWKDLVRDLEHVPLPLWNESVFRFSFIRSLLQANPSIYCETEWEHHDLLISIDGMAVIVEFKFFQSRRGIVSPEGRRAKGGAGVQNFREFCEAAEKLSLRVANPALGATTLRLGSAFLIIAYADSREGKIHPKRQFFSDFYDVVKLPEHLATHVFLREQVTLDPIQCKHSESTIKCKFV